MKKRKQSVVSLVVVLAIFSCTLETGWSSGKPADNTVRPQAGAAQLASFFPATSPSTPVKLALLVGINNYLHSDKISALAGSINDVEEMRQLLIGKFEFPPENILVLTDSQATHAAIINAIQTQLIAKAQQGDIVVFHYSGHGSQMKDVTGKMISGVDETIVPYDSRDPAGKVFDISGAELHPLLLQLAKKTKNVTFILDSCHSGTLVRGARVRSVVADTRTPPPLPAYTVAAMREVGAVSEDTAPKFAAIAAATSRESAFEHFADGKDHGALTYFLVRQLRTAKAGVTYRDIMDNVAGDVTANYPSQHVSLEGAEADQYVFGDGSSLTRVYVTASPSLLTPHGVTLTVGQVQGATLGSAYDVYPPGSRKFAPPERPVAKIRIASVGALSSEATFISGSSIPRASRAVEREHQYGKSRMRVFLDGVEGSATLQSIRTAMQTMTNVELVDRPSACNMQLKESGGRIQTLGADSTTLSTPVAVSDPGAVDRVIGQLKSWAKWFGVLSIHNPHPEIELQYTISGSQTRDPMARVGRPDMGVWEGEKVEASITNSTERDLYLTILDLSTDGSVSVVYPEEQGAMEVLKPGQKLSRSFTTFVPKGRSVVTDILKVFVSYKPIDLRSLTQGSIRGMGQEDLDPLQALLDDSSEGTRGVSPVLTKSVDLGTWDSRQRVLMVKQRR
jgi:Caspase domain